MGCSILTTLAISVVVVSGGLATEPKLITPCSCRYQNLTYDLSPLARTDGKPRFTLIRESHVYAYNPCLPFNMSAKVKAKVNSPDANYNCINVAICSLSAGNDLNPLGYHSKGQVTCKASDQSIALVFKQGGYGKNLGWKTTVELICNKTALNVNEGLRIKATGIEPVFQIVSKYSCSRESPRRWTLQIAKKLPNNQQFVYLILAVALGVLLFISIVVIVTVCVKNRRLCQDNRRQDNEGAPLLKHGNEAIDQNLEEDDQLQQEDETHPGERPDDVLHEREADEPQVNEWPGNEQQINEGGIQQELNELPEEHEGINEPINGPGHDHVNDPLGEEIGHRGQPRPGNLPAAEVDENDEEAHPELLGEDERRNELIEEQVNDPQGQPRAGNQLAENVEEDHSIVLPRIQPEGEEARDRPRNQPVERDE